MIMAIIGLLAPFLPDVLGMFRASQDHKQELEMLELRHRMAKDEFGWRIEEVNVKADIAEMRAIRKPHASYGIQLLDKAQQSDGVIWKWAINCVFLMFAVLDWAISSVRPGVTYWIFGLYAAIKTATIWRLFEITESMTDAILNDRVWTTFDQELLMLVVSFWFGQRLRARAIKGG